MVCGNQEWHLADPPASWANLGIEAHMTIYIEFELRPMEILVKVNNGEAEPDVYEEEEFDLTLSECRNLDDLTDAVMNNLSIDLGDHFKIYVDGFIKNDFNESLRSVFWEMNPNNYFITFVKDHVEETSSSESEVEDEVVNQVIFEDLAFPFEKINLPLRKSSFTRLGTVVLSDIDDFLDDLKGMDVLGKPLSPKDFQLKLDGVILDRYESLKDQVSHPEVGNYRLIYTPKFQIQMVMNGSRERVMLEVKPFNHVDYLRWQAHFEFEIDRDDIKLRYRGRDLDDDDDDDEELSTVFGLNCEYGDCYALYEIEVDVRVNGGGGGVKRKAVAISDMREQPDDPPNIKSVFNIQAFVSKAWLKSLTDEEAEAYNKDLKNVKGMPHQIERTLNRIKEYADLKVGLKNQV